MATTISSKVVKSTEKLRARDPNLFVHFNPVFGTPAHISGTLSRRTKGKPDSAALTFLKENSEMFRMRKDAKDLKMVRKVDSKTGSHVKYQQTFRDVPIFGATVTVHLDSANSVQQVDNEYVPPPLLQGMSVKPAISSEAAIKKARSNVRTAGALRGEITSELVILPDDTNPILSWRVDIPANKPLGDWQVFDDANTGKVITKRNLLKTVDGQGMVFDPNPIVTANNNTLTDSSPAAVLNAQRVTRTLRDITEIVDTFINKVTLNDTSIDGPAVAFGNGRVYIAWTGTDSRHRVNVMSSVNGRTFINKVTLSEKSIARPALAFLNGKLYLAWTGTDDRHRLNILSSTDGRNFGNKVTLSETSPHGPALAASGSILYLAWTGRDSRNKLNTLQSANGRVWVRKKTLNETSPHGPALAFGGTTLYLGWTGKDSRHRLNVFQSTNGTSWVHKSTLSDTSIDGPSQVCVNGRLHIAWSGRDSSHRLNTMFSTDGRHFRGKATLNDTSPYAPALTSGNGRIFLGWTGRDSSHHLNMMSSTDHLLYSLEGPYCRVVNLDNPAVAPITTHDPNGFNFGRDQNGFEDVMAYYHIDTTQRHIRQWFSNVNNRQIRVDTHDNYLGEFQAFYSPQTKSLGFGNGGPRNPDMAEDADVILHEYGHAIQDNQVPGWGYHHEGGSMGEGFGDILSCLLFAEAGGGFNPAITGEWAGAGLPISAGGIPRRCDLSLHFPEDMFGEVHADGRVWAGAMWALYLSLGGNSTNVSTRRNAAQRVMRTLIESHFLLNTNARFMHGANAFIRANRAIYNTREATIRNILVERGLLKTTLGETSKVGMDLMDDGVRTYVSWTGVDQRQSLNVMSTTNGHQFGNKVTLSDTSPHGPALSFGNRNIYLAWTGKDSRHRLNIIQSRNGSTWANKATLVDTSIAAPALAFFKGQVYLAWTGTDSRHSLNIMRSNDGKTWTNKVTLNETSDHSPALTTDGARLFLSWTGTDANNRLNVISSANGINFTHKAILSDTSINGPALAVAVGTLFILWTGKDSQHRLNVMRASNRLGTAFTQKYILSEWSNLGPTSTMRNGHVSVGWIGGDNRLNIIA